MCLYDSITVIDFPNVTLISGQCCCYTSSSQPNQQLEMEAAVLGATYQVTAAGTYSSDLHYFPFSCKAFLGKLPVDDPVALDLRDSCAVPRAAAASSWQNVGAELKETGGHSVSTAILSRLCKKAPSTWTPFLEIPVTPFKLRWEKQIVRSTKNRSKQSLSL